MSEHDYLYSAKLRSKFKYLLEYFEIDNVVYVGLPPANIFRAQDQMWWYYLCKQLEMPYIIVEKYKPWADELSNEGLNVVCDDVCNYEPPTSDSILLWSHGPEHVDKDIFINCLPKLLNWYVNVVVSMPYGVWEQGGKCNPYEEHRWNPYPEDLEELGFEYISTNGPKDNKGDLFGVYYD